MINRTNRTTETRRFEGLEDEFLYKNYLGIKQRIAEMLEDDYFDVDKVKFTLWYLDEVKCYNKVVTEVANKIY